MRQTRGKQVLDKRRTYGSETGMGADQLKLMHDKHMAGEDGGVIGQLGDVVRGCYGKDAAHPCKQIRGKECKFFRWPMLCHEGHGCPCYQRKER